MHDFAPVPHPVIVTHHSSGSGSEVPTSYVIAYTAVALLVWVGAAILLARHTDERGEHDFDPILAVLGGSLAALVWPLSAVAAGIWCLVVRATRTKSATTKDTC